MGLLESPIHNGVFVSLRYRPRRPTTVQFLPHYRADSVRESLARFPWLLIDRPDIDRHPAAHRRAKSYRAARIKSWRAIERPQEFGPQRVHGALAHYKLARMKDSQEPTPEARHTPTKREFGQRHPR